MREQEREIKERERECKKECVCDREQEKVCVTEQKRENEQKSVREKAR